MIAKWIFQTIAACSLLSAQIAGVAAQTLSSTYVSGTTGVQGAACDRANPCKFISEAIVKTVVGGQVTCLDAPYPSGFSITRSITIDCSAAGQFAQAGFGGGVDGFNGAYSINVPPSDTVQTVKLRGLHLEAGSSDAALLITQCAAVYLENSTLRGGTRAGILDRRFAGQTRLYVQDTHIHNANGPGVAAVAGAVGITVLDNVRIQNSVYGVAAASGNNVFVSRSIISGHSQAAIEADPGGQITVDNSSLTHSNIGVQAFGTIRISNSNVSFNNTAFQGNPVSLGQNHVAGNVSVGATPVAASGALADAIN